MNTTDYTPTRPAGFDYDAALAEIQENIRRKAKVQKLITYFKEEESRLSYTVEDRKKDYDTEQADMDNLQSATLTLLFYSVMGVKEEKLSKEESEALAAKAAYETAVGELEHVHSRLSELRAELRSLGNCERYYEEMLAEKKAHLLKTSTEVNAEVAALEEEKAAIIRDSKELKEAMESGQYALQVATSIMDTLKRANYLSTMDTRASNSSRHGALVYAARDNEIDYEKHNTLVRLDNSIQTLDKYLRDFAAELDDVSAVPMEHIPTTHFEGGLLFIDRWVDDLISEIVVDVKLHSIEKQMKPLLEKLTPLVEGLQAECAAREAACAEIDKKIRALVLEK